MTCDFVVYEGSQEKLNDETCFSIAIKMILHYIDRPHQIMQCSAHMVFRFEIFSKRINFNAIFFLGSNEIDYKESPRCLFSIMHDLVLWESILEILFTCCGRACFHGMFVS